MVFLEILLKPVDFIVAPICFGMLCMLMVFIVRKYRDDTQRRLFMKAFYFKMLFALLFTLMCSFYYRSGDTWMYYDATRYLTKAVLDNPDNLPRILLTQKLEPDGPLISYFTFTDSRYPVYEAMQDAGNFMGPRFALIPALLFGNSYLCVSMCFAFFALGGAIRLYKFFQHYFPAYYREIALATLFLPSVTLWSSGLMKDPLCFGAVGYLTYAMLNLFVKRKKIFTSILWAAFSIYLLYFTKVYILLAIAPAILIWLVTEINKLVKVRTLRQVLAVFTFAIGVFLAYRLLDYVTSEESLRQFRLDNIAQSSEYNRSLYESFSRSTEGSYFAIRTESPVLLLLSGIVAALFRPFLWEINGVTAFLSALEALFFFYLTLNLFVKRGVGPFFKKIFSQPLLLFCFIFSIVFTAAVGSSALNFGSLSRYKIPALPFYLVMLLVLHQQFRVQFPAWLKKILGYRVLPVWMQRKAQLT